MPFRWLQYLISLIPNRAILFDINDIKERHANLTESRLPTIKSYRIHHRKKGGEQEPPRFLESQKGRAAEKKERAEKERACVAPTLKIRLTYHGRENFLFFLVIGENLDKNSILCYYHLSIFVNLAVCR